MVAALPEGWSVQRDEQGRTFFANIETGECTWTAPFYSSENELPSFQGGIEHLPDGWKMFEDAEGRTFYSNTLTGQTQWDFPLEAVKLWSADLTYVVGAENIFVDKAPSLDEDTYTSVVQTCDLLNAGSVPGVECGYCIMWSKSKECYFLLWRSDREQEAFTALGIEDGNAECGDAA
eukprot:TRINITY_DN17242_c0_g1_i1.p1 TRINITY_DN17242_c0_g1~~TRINITY_DN17242_c0_g1_i1.p1  ORF type:complete len:177 (+),score=33.52 TRINITY_DN17242_c0_g1_i1:128-658(+)